MIKVEEPEKGARRQSSKVSRPSQFQAQHLGVKKKVSDSTLGVYPDEGTDDGASEPAQSYDIFI